MFRRIRLLADANQVVRPLLFCVVAIVMAALAMAWKGWNSTSLVMGFVLAGVACLAVLQVRRAVRHLESQSFLLRQASVEAERHYIAVLQRIMEYSEDRDVCRKGHSRNVARTARLIAQHLGLSEQECDLLALAGELHDIGLLAVPEAMLGAKGKFGMEEFRCIQKHPEASYDMLKPLESLAPLLPAVRYHHERMNGTGYPAGLSGQDIPLSARILAVADAYDAMTHDRPQRPALSVMEAVNELRRCCPAGYDKQCVEAIANLVNHSDIQDACAEPAETLA